LSIAGAIPFIETDLHSDSFVSAAIADIVEPLLPNPPDKSRKRHLPSNATAEQPLLALPPSFVFQLNSLSTIKVIFSVDTQTAISLWQFSMLIRTT
jgi:hypothetical protein